MNFLVSDAEKQDQSGKENSAANDLGIFEEINEEKISEEEPGVAISSQLDKVTMKCCSEESKNPAVVNKILMGLEIPAKCSGIRVHILNEVVAKNGKGTPSHERADNRLLDIQKELQTDIIRT